MEGVGAGGWGFVRHDHVVRAIPSIFFRRVHGIARARSLRPGEAFFLSSYTCPGERGAPVSDEGVLPRKKRFRRGDWTALFLCSSGSHDYGVRLRGSVAASVLQTKAGTLRGVLYR
ncbi:unnamed protein product [Sphacelaria rigidula]